MLHAGTHQSRRRMLWMCKRLLIRLGRFDTLLTTVCGHIWTDTNQSTPCFWPSNLPFLKKSVIKYSLKSRDSNSNSPLIGLCRGFHHIHVPTFTAMGSTTRKSEQPRDLYQVHSKTQGHLTWPLWRLGGVKRQISLKLTIRMDSLCPLSTHHYLFLTIHVKYLHQALIRRSKCQGPEFPTVRCLHCCATTTLPCTRRS